MKTVENCVCVGCGALIINEKNQALFLKRTSKTGNMIGLWSQPGGAVKIGEKVEDAVKREIKEELDVGIEVIKFLCFTEGSIEEGNQNWLSLNYLAKIIGGEVTNMEPEKHEEVKWFSLNDLPENLAQCTKDSVKEYLKLKK